MTIESTGPSDDVVGLALADLGRQLVIESDDAFVGKVLTAVDATPPPSAVRPQRTRRRVLFAAAAAIVAVLVAVVAIAPAREAVARWFGIGSVQITRTSDPLEPPAATTTVAAAPPAAVDLDALGREAGFVPKLADPVLAGPLLAAIADPAVPSGLVELRYRDVTIVQMAARTDDRAVLTKLVGPDTTITPVQVGPDPGVWLAGDPHAVAVVDADGRTILDDVRRAGNVLLWEHDGITTRVEGAPSLEAALAIAATLH